MICNEKKHRFCPVLFSCLQASVQLDEQALRERFSLIMAEWTMGDN